MQGTTGDGAPTSTMQRYTKLQNKIMELVTGDQVAAWILIAFLVGYFIYKEWPEFSRRISGEAVEKEKEAAALKAHKRK